MIRRVLFLLLFLGECGFLSIAGAQPRDLPGRVSDVLQVKINNSIGEQEISCMANSLSHSGELRDFYARRHYRPVWITEDGLRPQAIALVKALHDSHLEGLSPRDYHVEAIEPLFAEIGESITIDGTAEPARLATLELLLSDAFFLYAAHLVKGCENTEVHRRTWHFQSREAELAEMLESAAEGSAIEAILEGLIPRHEGYARLKSALSWYRDIMHGGGWPSVPEGPTLRIGDTGTRVATLKSRLAISGDLYNSTLSSGDVFDEALEDAVRRFQERHGLDVDGIVGPATLAALNVPVEDRISQIRLNMERWRWLPEELGWRYILVNVPSFEMVAVEDHRNVMSMRVVVGRKSRPTPVLTSTVKYLQLNPSWYVPPRIARHDILPRIRKDPLYLVREGFHLLENSQETVQKVDPETIEWSEITKDNFSFKLRQEPGPSNALGRVKFIFPNEFSVYLHDTPSRQLFEKTKRTSSSGCIRIEKPIELVQYLLRDAHGWTRERLLAALDSGKTLAVRIPEPIPVHIVYFTCWVDEYGRMCFREDVYEQDSALAKALDKPFSSGHSLTTWL